jgi:hypothetical protein
VGNVPPELWNADRLNRPLGEIDTAIAATQYDRAVGLAYTCLEGFYGAFFRAKAPGQAAPNEIIALSRWIRDHLRATIVDYPDEVLNLVGQTAHAVDRVDDVPAIRREPTACLAREMRLAKPVSCSSAAAFHGVSTEMIGYAACCSTEPVTVKEANASVRTNNSESLINRWIGRPSESEGVAANAAGQFLRRGGHRAGRQDVPEP